MELAPGSTDAFQKLEQAGKAFKPGATTWRVLVDPQTDLPEQKSLTLLIMSPSYALPDNGGREAIEKQVLSLGQKCGARVSHSGESYLIEIDKLYQNHTKKREFRQ